MCTSYNVPGASVIYCTAFQCGESGRLSSPKFDICEGEGVRAGSGVQGMLTDGLL